MENDELTTITEVPRQEWSPFMDDFSRRHAGARASLLLTTPDLGGILQFIDRPFVGVTTDDEGVAILVGDARANHFGHYVNHVIRVWVDQEPRSKATLHLESHDGSEAALRID